MDGGGGMGGGSGPSMPGDSRGGEIGGDDDEGPAAPFCCSRFAVPTRPSVVVSTLLRILRSISHYRSCHVATATGHSERQCAPWTGVGKYYQIVDYSTILFHYR